MALTQNDSGGNRVSEGVARIGEEGKPAAVETSCVLTRLCKFYAVGRCAAGVACNFAHSVEELRPVADLRNTKLCTSVKRGRKCWSLNCTFAHSMKELHDSRKQTYRYLEPAMGFDLGGQQRHIDDGLTVSDARWPWVPSSNGNSSGITTADMSSRGQHSSGTTSGSSSDDSSNAGKRECRVAPAVSAASRQHQQEEKKGMEDLRALMLEITGNPVAEIIRFEQ